MELQASIDDEVFTVGTAGRFIFAMGRLYLKPQGILDRLWRAYVEVHGARRASPPDGAFYL